MVRDIHFVQPKKIQDDISSNLRARKIDNLNRPSLNMLESSKRKVPENFLRGSLRVESGGSSSCYINLEKCANVFLSKDRKEDLRIEFLSTCDEAKMSTGPSVIGSSSIYDKSNRSTSLDGIRSLSVCHESNERRSPSLMKINEDGANVSLSTNSSIRRSSPKIKLRKVHEESKTSEQIDIKSEDSANKTIRKHLHVRAYKKLFTKHAKERGNHGDKCCKEKPPLQRHFVDTGANTSNEIKVGGDAGSAKECIQDDRDLYVETSESLEKKELKNTMLLNTVFVAKSTPEFINQEHKCKFNGSKCGRMVLNLESNSSLEQSGEEICQQDLSEVDIESPPMLEKLGVGDGGICNSEFLANLDGQISEENIFIVSKDSTHTQTEYNICLVCRQPGQLICCWGKGCKRCYHLSCFNPVLRDIPPGAWLCNFCVKKKMDLGVHSVLDEIESVWDVDEGLQNGKRYFVKYKGLAHVHNCWISENELLHDAPSLLANIGKNGQREVNKWRKEWTEPERLLQKRLVAPLEVADDYTSVSVSESLNCCIEWLVKWNGLEYDQSTWEMENSLLFFSSDAPRLIKDYECRRAQVINSYDPLRADKALQIKKEPFCKLSNLPAECSVELGNEYLSYINCLREFWHKSVNAVLVDGQERISKAIFFVLSLQSHACRPSLIITTSGSFQLWKAGFVRLAPSVNVIMYQGDKDIRKMIQNIEFYEESGRLMFQVLLADSKAVIEDLDDIACIGWESLIVDECQNSKMTRYLEQLNSLITDFKLLLFNGQLKDSLSEYRILLSFLETGGTMDNGLVGLQTNNHDARCALTKLKEKFSRHIVFECNADSSKFLEYWVPVPLSNVQLEQYCSILLSNATVLLSNLRSDVVGALHNILMTVRKCCDHPYLVDGELRGLLTRGLQSSEFLNAEVCASGKLCLLGKILQDIKDRGLRVVLLFQSLGGYEKVSLGDILDDFLQQRFGVNAYERIEAGMVMAKKIDALQKFNDKEIGRFIFLIEKRACLPSVKLYSVDAIILFNSDWNPLNDLRSLEKISVESQHNSIRFFRFYTSFTVEEKLLMLTKQESNVDNINRNIAHLLLGWGTSYLFRKLDQLHSSAKSTCISEPSFDKFGLNDVILEISAHFPGKTETSKAIPCSVLMKAQLSGGTYSRDGILMGEKEGISSPDKDLPIFWSGLFEGRRPKYLYISQHSQRIRKRIQNVNGFSTEAMKGDGVRRKRRKINNIVDSATTPKFSKEKGGEPEEIHKPCMLESECGKQKLEDQRNLLMLLRPELSELCDILGLPEFVKGVAQEFLVYIMNNLDVSTNQITVLQALKISLCWRAASMSRLSLNRSESLSLARKYLKFECTEQEAYSVYSKLRMLKEKFPCQSRTLENLSVRNILDDQSPFSKTVDNGRETLDERAVETKATGKLTLGVTDGFPIGYNTSEQPISQQGSYPIGETTGKFQLEIGSLKDSPFKNQIDVIKEIFSRRSEDLVQIHQAEVLVFEKQMHEDSLKLEKTYEIDLELIRSIHIDETVRKAKLNVLTREFLNNLDRFNQHRKQQKQKLMSMQLDTWNKEQELKYGWLEKAKTGMMNESLDAHPKLERRCRLENFLEASEFIANCNKSGSKILNYSCPSGETSAGSEGALEVPSNSLNEGEENVRLRDNSLVSATSVIGDNLEQAVQDRLSPKDSDISAPQSEALNPVSSKAADIINGTLTDDPNGLQFVPNPEQNADAPLLSLQRLASHVAASTSSSIQKLCNDEHARPAEALTSDNNQDKDSAHEITVRASDSIVNLSPHIEMMCCNDVATSNSINGPLPLAEHEQERLPPAGYQEATQSHHSVEMSEVPAQQEIMAVAVESEPSNHQIPENDIHSLRPQEYPPYEGIPCEHLGSCVIQNSVAFDWSHSSNQQTDVLVQDAIEATVLESESSIQQIPDNNLHTMRPQEDLPLERPHLENLRSTGIQQDEPSKLFQNFSSIEWVPPRAISANLLCNELFRVHRQDISCTKKHENKKLLLQSECEQDIENVRRKYDILLQDAEKGFCHEKNMLAKICQKIFWHQVFAEELRLKFCDHEKDSSPSFQGQRQNSSQRLKALQQQPQLASRPSSSSPMPLSTGPQLHPSQTTNQALTAPYFPRLRPQASVPPVISIRSTGLSTHASPSISSDAVRGPVKPPPNHHTGPINPCRNIGLVRSPAPHLQHVRPRQTSNSSLNTPTLPSLVSPTAAPSVPPNLVSTFPAPFPMADSSTSNACGLSQPTPLRFNPPQFELPHYAETDGLLESLFANFNSD